MGDIDVAALRGRAIANFQRWPQDAGPRIWVQFTRDERDALLDAVEERDRLRSELAAINAFRAEPLAGVRALIGEDEDMDDEAVMGSVVAILLTRQATAQRLREEKAKNTALAIYARRLRNYIAEIPDALDGYVDVEDGDHGPRANPAMTLTQEADALLALAMPGEKP